jgi:hypothetical protein
MKCYKHPDKDGVGICSKCGRGICIECARTGMGKLICKDCSEVSKAWTPATSKAYNLIGAIIGLLGAVNTVLVGSYIITFFLSLSSIGIFFHFAQAYMVGITASVAASTFMLLCGSYSMWKGRARQGGLLSFVAGTITTVLCVYFTLVFPLLHRLGMISYFLPAPALISGIIGILKHQ